MISLLSHLHDRVRESALKSSGRSGWIGISSRAHAKDQRSEDNEGVLHDRHLQLEMSLRIQQRRRLGKVGVITTSMLSSLFARRASPWPCGVDIDGIPRQVFFHRTISYRSARGPLRAAQRTDFRQYSAIDRNRTRPSGRGVSPGARLWRRVHDSALATTSKTL